MDIALSLDDIDALVHLKATVVWDDKHGKTGFSFQCPDVQSEGQLVSWLDNHFLGQLGSPSGWPRID